MTIEEMKAELERLQKKAFFLAMKDRWSDSDYELDRKLSDQIRELEKKIQEAE